MKKNKEKELQKKCIKKFFYSEYKHIAKAGGAKMQSIGFEASYEACEALFKEGKLILKAFNEDEFHVFLKKSPQEFELIYSSKEKEK